MPSLYIQICTLLRISSATGCNTPNSLELSQQEPMEPMGMAKPAGKRKPMETAEKTMGKTTEAVQVVQKVAAQVTAQVTAQVGAQQAVQK